jgi:hypothetical protein
MAWVLSSRKPCAFVDEFIPLNMLLAIVSGGLLLVWR